ncbi:hypothetical protein C8J57DRAFT_1297255 [Mycena rebaudengoi]|nr:hypothetical protein C8J57DRAFT_1297255 [Mycena rebaudengoi]
MSNRDDRYYNTHRARTPSADQSGVFFQTGQGGRTLLPPISTGFPISRFPGLFFYITRRTVPVHSNQYSQHRSSQTPARYDYNQQYNNNQWQPNHAPMTAPQAPAFPFYDDHRYSTQQAYPVYPPPRSATAAPRHPSGHPKLPPINTPPSYATPTYNATPDHIRSPTASYPASYTTAYPTPNSQYGYHMHGDPRSSLNPQIMANDPRSVSPYGHGSSHASPPTPPPVSPTDETTVKKKRKRADAAQLRVLNETYARTAFPSTEERLALAKALDMSPRSVQIWFQNKRQSMRQTNRQSSSAHQSFSLSPDEQIIDEMDNYEMADVIDPRKWPRGY